MCLKKIIALFILWSVNYSFDDDQFGSNLFERQFESAFFTVQQLNLISTNSFFSLFSEKPFSFLLCLCIIVQITQQQQKSQKSCVWFIFHCKKEIKTFQRHTTWNLNMTETFHDGKTVTTHNASSSTLHQLHMLLVH